jgi:M6 family metalloprotease-like protein
MDTLIRWRPTRLMAAARAGILFLLLTAGAGSSIASADGTGLGPMKPGGKSITGSQPFINILCKFPDRPDEPQTAARMRTIFGIDGQGSTANSAYPTVDRYWREVSYKTIFPNAGIDLDRSAVVGWVTLPSNQADYWKRDANNNPIPDGDGDFEQDLDRLRDDCIAAAEAQVVNPDGTRGVNFNNFKGVNLFFNGELDASHGAPEDLTLDNVRRTGLPVTWINVDGVKRHDVIVHEMGHAFGLNHSSGPYQSTYDSPWDAMSGGENCFPGAEFLQQGFGCIGVHTVAAHKAYLGWLPAARRFDAKPGPATTITLSRLAQPVQTPGVFWMAKLPIAGTADQYYTVELRTGIGYDRGVPEGVVVHKVNEQRDDRNAQAVDPDHNGFLNASSRLLAGGAFTDDATGVSVRVESIDPAAGTARVTLGISPRIKIDDVTVSEPSAPAGTAPARFTVRLSQASTATVRVDFATGALTATGNVDYAHSQGTLTIPAGSTTGTITVHVKLDTVREQDELFLVTLKNAVGAVIGDSQATGTIRDRPPAAPAPTPCPPAAVNCREP